MKETCGHGQQCIDEREDDYERLVRCVCLVRGKTLWSNYFTKTARGTR